MKEPKILILVVFALLIGQSCEKSEPDPINVVSVEQDFEVFPSQEIGPDGSSFFLTVKATEPDSCLNSILDATMNLEGDKITVIINGIIEPEFCLEGELLLEKRFSLPAAPHSYQIEFIKDDFISTSGELTITDSQIWLDIESLGGVFVTENLINIIQENYVWGYFYLDDATTGTGNLNLDEVLSEYMVYVTDYMPLPEGDYGYFVIKSNGEVEIDGGKSSTKQFAYEGDPDRYWESALRGLDPLTEFRPSLKYYITNGRGDTVEN